MQTNYRNHMNKLVVLFTAFTSLSANAQVYPTNWWVGMHYSKPELMIHLKDIGNASSVSVAYPGVTITDWHRVENHNYLFLHLMISPSAKPGRMGINVQEKKGTRSRMSLLSLISFPAEPATAPPMRRA